MEKSRKNRLKKKFGIFRKQVIIRDFSLFSNVGRTFKLSNHFQRLSFSNSSSLPIYIDSSVIYIFRLRPRTFSACRWEKRLLFALNSNRRERSVTRSFSPHIFLYVLCRTSIESCRIDCPRQFFIFLIQIFNIFLGLFPIHIRNNDTKPLYISLLVKSYNTYIPCTCRVSENNVTPQHTRPSIYREQQRLYGYIQSWLHYCSAIYYILSLRPLQFRREQPQINRSHFPRVIDENRPLINITSPIDGFSQALYYGRPR